MLAVTLFLASCSKPTPPTSNDNLIPVPTLSAISTTPSLTGKLNQTKTQMQNETIATIKTTNGDILVKLYSDKAPNTTKNFLNKGNSGFYSNLTFHRVEPGFVVQGGDPKGNGTGGGTITSELNDIPFKRGSLGLARTPATKEVSNDSQFYICLSTDTCSQLSGEYVNFGEVISGMDIVDKIQKGDKILEISSYTK